MYMYLNDQCESSETARRVHGDCEVVVKITVPRQKLNLEEERSIGTDRKHQQSPSSQASRARGRPLNCT